MKIDILLIGVGGTGGCFFTKMARFLSGMQFEDMEISFRIMDGDFVEAKNLSRQPFSDEDIGLNKAVALASAAEEALDVKVKAYPQFLRPENTDILKPSLRDDYARPTDVRIIIGAVDNHACRKLLHDFFVKYNSAETLFYIDSANEISAGEIVIGKKKGSKIETPDRIHYYPEILEDNEKPAYEMSCEELNQAAPQHLATNSLAADLMFAYVSQLITAGYYIHQAPAGIVYFDAFKMFSRFHEYSEEVYGKIECN